MESEANQLLNSEDASQYTTCAWAYSDYALTSRAEDLPQLPYLLHVSDAAKKCLVELDPEVMQDHSASTYRSWIRNILLNQSQMNWTKVSIED
jgi:hypothetical protein